MKVEQFQAQSSRICFLQSKRMESNLKVYSSITSVGYFLIFILTIRQEPEDPNQTTNAEQRISPKLPTLNYSSNSVRTSSSSISHPLTPHANNIHHSGAHGNLLHVTEGDNHPSPVGSPSTHSVSSSYVRPTSRGSVRSQNSEDIETVMEFQELEDDPQEAERRKKCEDLANQILEEYDTGT